MLHGATAQGQKPRWLDYAMVLIAQVVLLILLEILQPVLPLGSYGGVYAIIAMGVAYRFGAGPAIFSFLLGYLTFNVFFIHRSYQIWPLAISSEDWARQASFLISVIIVAAAAAHAKREKRQIQTIADEAETHNMILKRELSKHAKLEASLEQSEERLRGFFENRAVGTAIITSSREWILVNDKLCEILGYSREELLKLTSTQLIHPDDLAADIEQFNRLAVGETDGYTLDSRFIRNDGSAIYGLLSVSCVREEDRSLKYVTAILLDITERKRSEQLVALMGFALDHVKEAAFLLNEKTQFHYVNEESCSSLGYTREELLGMTLSDIHPDPLVEPWLQHWAEMNTERTSKTLETRHRAKTGDVFPVEVNVNYFEYEGHSYVMSFARDITERKQAEQEKQKFYCDTIMSITQGKLKLVSMEEIMAHLDSPQLVLSVASSYETVIAREKLRDFFELIGIPESKSELFEMAVGEAMTNAIKHASGGKVFAGANARRFWVAVSDTGPGISTLSLPSATLRTGFSTKGTMGMGFTIILEATDEVLLCTGPEGTTVILARNIAKTVPEPSLDELVDTWDSITSAAG